MPSTPDVVPATRSRSRRARRDRRRRKRLIVALVSAGTLVVLLGCVVGGAALLWHRTIGSHLTVIPDSVAFPDEKGRPAASTDGSKNVLLLGSDSRLEPDEHDLTAKGDQRSDVMMLAHVPADGSGVQIASLMRDLYVPVPGHGQAKINAALAWGGTALSIATVEGLLDTRIDHVAVIDFTGLADMTTALGGVWVDNKVPFTRADEYDTAGRYFAAGPIKLEGAGALSFVRERKAFPTGDYQRVRNQQLLLKGMLDRAISRDVLADPSALASFATETSKSVTVDAGFSLPAMASLAWGLRGIDSADIDFFTLPTAGTGSSPDGQSIVEVDSEAVARLKAALASDEVGAFAASLSKGDSGSR
ncbi:LCP family protein [Frondihabitans cladoniiphilus]|uniref:LCP family protein n=1 Tax=Frondihabitans cladoniiphilus TaxID=715785 RepID=A0ABP8W0X7_9MICO